MAEAEEEKVQPGTPDLTDIPNSDSNEQLAIANEKRNAAALRTSGARRRAAATPAKTSSDEKPSTEDQKAVDEHKAAAKQKPPEGRSAKPLTRS